MPNNNRKLLTNSLLLSVISKPITILLWNSKNLNKTIKTNWGRYSVIKTIGISLWITEKYRGWIFNWDGENSGGRVGPGDSWTLVV
jgi:hypothetical protein